MRHVSSHSYIFRFDIQTAFEHFLSWRRPAEAILELSRTITEWWTVSLNVVGDEIHVTHVRRNVAHNAAKELRKELQQHS